MSWIISVVLAGMMFTSSENSLPIQANSSFIETNKTQVVRLDESERFEQTYSLSPNGKVSVSNVNGSITVEAWDRNEVKLVAVKTADTREHLADVDIKIDSKPDSLCVQADYGEWKRGNNGVWKNRNNDKLVVEFHLTVPRTAILNEIETVNGGVTVSNMVSYTKVSAVNGDVKASNLRGTASLETVNGIVDADFSNLQTGSQISLSTVNGRANLLLPSDADATIRAESVNGNIINDFGLPVRKGQYVGRDLYGKVGNGDVKIKLESVNGELAVRRKQDGKVLRPATNLLQQKPLMNSDDSDNDSEDAVMSKEVRKAVKNAAKVKASVNVIPDMVNKEVLESVQKEMSKVKVEVDTEKMNAQIKEAMDKQKDAFARMGEAGWVSGSPIIEKKKRKLWR